MDDDDERGRGPANTRPNKVNHEPFPPTCTFTVSLSISPTLAQHAKRPKETVVSCILICPIFFFLDDWCGDQKSAHDRASSTESPSHAIATPRTALSLLGPRLVHLGAQTGGGARGSIVDGWAFLGGAEGHQEEVERALLQSNMFFLVRMHPEHRAHDALTRGLCCGHALSCCRPLFRSTA